MATIRQRKDTHRWQAIVQRVGHKTRSKSFKKEIDAIKWAREIETNIDAGTYVDRTAAEKMTLRTALLKYKDVSALKDGAEQEKWRIAAWLKDPLAMRSLASLHGGDFAAWRDKRLLSVVASTVQKDLALISHLFTVARKEWRLPISNPIADMTMPSVDNARQRRIEGDEELRILRELRPINGRSPLMIPLVQLAIETGARQSELLALLWDDVDTSEGARSVLFRGKKRADGKDRTKGKKKQPSNEPKTRSVPLSRQAMAVLDDLKMRLEDGEPKVFPISSQVVKHAYSSALKRAGIIDLTFHDLRHEATSRLADIFEMQKLMKITGHKSPRMLARYYHPRTEDLAREMDK